MSELEQEIALQKRARKMKEILENDFYGAIEDIYRITKNEEQTLALMIMACLIAKVEIEEKVITERVSRVVQKWNTLN
jgi:hypothetical protein